MNDLARAAHIAETSDMKDVVDNTGFVISRIYKNLEGAVSVLGSSIAMVNQKVENLHLNQTYITAFHAKSYVQILRQEVFPEIASAGPELDQLASHTFDLSPKDHWDQNGVLKYFSDWSDTGRQATFWVGGRSGNQETWVTEMSVDLIRALESQDKTAVYVFCAGIHGSLSPSVLARRMIVQLLESFPLLAFHNPELFNTRKLSRATTFTQLWSICKMLADQAGEVFLVIDRIDKCKPESEASIEDVLLPCLIEYHHLVFKRMKT
ncbi:hypothetical protein H2199_007661 [Coniosporium tulheliwenetii]|uniref:Uncharacterized protein n=1 Tax=Coniosporium tulheliwenetii TaxID=3383036 RepID=A0ACC2YQD8_9PEZI|nr:hypothetical protein H2199_007661 [Cladosporium sp. JES 115]